MKLSPTGYSNPIKSFERKLAPDFATREFRNPGIRALKAPRAPSGLGSLRHTMPHLRKGVPGMDSGGPISQIYASSRPNLYNPDPMARRILAAGRKMGTTFVNPDFRKMPGSDISFPYADGGAAPDEESAGTPAPEELMEGDENLSEPEQQQKQVVIEALLALEGRHPDPRQALKAFVETFGPQALSELRQLVARGQPEEGEAENELPGEGAEAPPAEPDEQDDLAAAGGGLLRGPGSGQSDEIEGTTPSGRPVLLSDGEYVIDAPTVAALGDGSTDAGARRLDDMRKKIRTAAYGHDKQAKPMKNGGQAILVELGG